MAVGTAARAVGTGVAGCVLTCYFSDCVKGDRKGIGI